jgi:hypothetical protein
MRTFNYENSEHDSRTKKNAHTQPNTIRKSHLPRIALQHRVRDLVPYRTTDVRFFIAEHRIVPVGFFVHESRSYGALVRRRFPKNIKDTVEDSTPYVGR